MAPLIILNSIANTFTFRYETMNLLFMFLFLFFTLYFLTLALKETHGYSDIRAVSTWFIGLIISYILITIFVGFLGLVYMLFPT